MGKEGKGDIGGGTGRVTTARPTIKRFCGFTRKSAPRTSAQARGLPAQRYSPTEAYTEPAWSLSSE